VNQAENGGSAYIAGLELSFQQHFSYLPGALSGLGLFANYSYATSQATNVNPAANRTDKPALLRQAPNTFNISPTYDRGRLSLRVGMAYNGANIFSYFFGLSSPTARRPREESRARTGTRTFFSLPGGRSGKRLSGEGRGEGADPDRLRAES
jgi:hypothetical protein